MVVVVQPPDRKAAEPHTRKDPSSAALGDTMATQSQGYKEEAEERKEEEQMVVQPSDRKAAEPHPRKDPSTTALRGTIATQTQGYKEEEE